MKPIIIITTILVLTSALPELKSKWIKFKSIHGKKYENPMEESKRFQIFQDNLKIIQAHNELYSKGLTTYKMGVNHFSDLTPQEFLKLTIASGPPPTLENTKPYRKPQNSSKKAIEVDWRIQGIVTEVKNQKDCSSCWSFSATGSLEGQLALTTGKLISLSEQNLIDCSKSFGNGGCGGGLASFAFKYIKENGIMSEDEYPYEASTNQCHSEPEKSIIKVSGYVQLPKGDENALDDAVETVGPIAVSIDSTKNMQHYQEGIFYDETCSSTRHNHAVLVVGYGVENQTEFYRVKNSWGADWGEDGYVRMMKNGKNHCAISSLPVYPTL